MPTRQEPAASGRISLWKLYCQPRVTHGQIGGNVINWCKAVPGHRVFIKAGKGSRHGKAILLQGAVTALGKRQMIKEN